MKQRGLFRAGQAAPPCLVPIDNRAKEIMAQLEPGKKALVSVHTARYPEHHGLVFMVLQKIADVMGTDVTNIVVSLMFETGRFDYVTLVDQTVVPIPHSLSPESMTQAEFQKFWDETEEIIKTKWRSLVTADDFAEIEKLMKGNQP